MAEWLGAFVLLLVVAFAAYAVGWGRGARHAWYHPDHSVLHELGWLAPNAPEEADRG